MDGHTILDSKISWLLLLELMTHRLDGLGGIEEFGEFVLFSMTSGVKTATEEMEVEKGVAAKLWACLSLEGVMDLILKSAEAQNNSQFKKKAAWSRM